MRTCYHLKGKLSMPVFNSKKRGMIPLFGASSLSGLIFIILSADPFFFHIIALVLILRFYRAGDTVELLLFLLLLMLLLLFHSAAPPSTPRCQAPLYFCFIPTVSMRHFS